MLVPIAPALSKSGSILHPADVDFHSEVLSNKSMGLWTASSNRKWFRLCLCQLSASCQTLIPTIARGHLKFLAGKFPQIQKRPPLWPPANAALFTTPLCYPAMGAEVLDFDNRTTVVPHEVIKCSRFARRQFCL